MIGAVGFAAFLAGGALTHHFSGNTDVAPNKSVREEPNHQGGTDRRMRIHNHRFGMYEVNKHSITTFPFSYTPFQEIISKHRTD